MRAPFDPSRFLDCRMISSAPQVGGPQKLSPRDRMAMVRKTKKNPHCSLAEITSLDRYNCLECSDYDLYFDCILISNMLHNMKHHFQRLLNPSDPKDDLKDISATSVTISPILLTMKEALLALLSEEEQQRFLPATKTCISKLVVTPHLEKTVY